MWKEELWVELGLVLLGLMAVCEGEGEGEGEEEDE